MGLKDETIFAYLLNLPDKSCVLEDPPSSRTSSEEVSDGEDAWQAAVTR